jgi:3-oxocholest-4-en-26-oyl-CoA dehydrogenase beta subunit
VFFDESTRAGAPVRMLTINTVASDLSGEEQVAIAKFWAADGGQRVVHAAQHIHGGVGVDRRYPLHRYFLAAKQLELTLGGATANLLQLGAIMADQAG